MYTTTNSDISAILRDAWQQSDYDTGHQFVYEDGNSTVYLNDVVSQ